MTARAQSGSDQAVAQALFDQARELMLKKDYAHACVLLEKSQALDPGGGTLLNLAVCYEDRGSIAHAYDTYEEVLNEAQRENRHDRADTARQRIAVLGPKLPRLVVVLPAYAGDPNLVVQIDDVVGGSSMLGTPAPVDPGMHHVRVSALGRKPWTWDGSIDAGHTVELTPDLPPLDALPPGCATAPCPPATTAPAVITASPPASSAPASTPPTRERSRLAVGSYVLGGVAIAATGTAVVTGILALDAQSSWKSQCLPDHGFCADPAQAQSDATRARTMAWVSTISFGVAAAAFLGAVLWPNDKLYDRLARSARGVDFAF